MKNNLKKTLSAILSGVLFIVQLSIPTPDNFIASDAAYTFSGGGKGTLSDPYIIKNVSDLNGIRENLSASFKLGNDIDLSEIKKWTPIGDEAKPFSGNFDGNGYCIKNVNISVNSDFGILNPSDKEYHANYGFFGYAKNATIEKLGIVDAQYNVIFDSYSGDAPVFSNVGGIVCKMDCSTLSESYFTGDIVNKCGENIYVRIGALACAAVNSSVITDCYSDSICNGRSYYKNTMVSSGVAWLTDSAISRCFVAGSIYGYNTVSYTYVAAFEASGSPSTVKNCVSLLKESYAEGVETYTDDFANFSNQENNKKISATSSAASSKATYEELKWNFTDKWYLKVNAKYPNLKVFKRGGERDYTTGGVAMNEGDIFYVTFLGEVGDNIDVQFKFKDLNGQDYTYETSCKLGNDSSAKVELIIPFTINEINFHYIFCGYEPTVNTSVVFNNVTTKNTTSTTITTTTSKPSTTTTTTTVPSGKNNEIKINQDNYSFLNDNAGFNTKYNLSSYFNDLLSSKACNTEWDAILNRITGNIKWSGSCYGMSSVQVLAKAGLLNVKTIDSSASCLYDWKSPKNNAEVESIINYFHMMQYSKVFTSKANKFTQMTNKKKIDSLINMCLQVKTGENPVVVCFNFSKSPSTRLDGGHAVVAYGVEYGTWSYSDTYNCRILISDPNVSGFKNENCIYINTDTYKWEIPYYQAKYYSCTNNDQNTNQKPYAQIRFATNDLAVLDVYGYLRNTNPTIETYIESTISINNNTSDFGVTFYDEKSTGSFEDSPCDLVFFSGLLDANATSKEVSAILPQADTPYEYYEKGYEAFDTTIDYTNSRLKANVSNGSYAIYQPEKSVEFAGQNSDYELSMTMNEGYYPTDWYNIKVQGVNSDKAKIVKTNNGYIISGDSLSEGIMIEASNRTVKAKLGVMLNYDSALIYEVNENTIGIKIDSNNDGVYETKFNPDYIGDINIDGQVSIADAVVLQKYLLNDQKINRQNYIAGDINMDGSVDVFDMVLMRKLLIKK